MYTLGIGDVVHDASICLMKHNKIINVIEEERITRVKHGVYVDDTQYSIQKNGRYFNNLIQGETSDKRERKILKLLSQCDEKIDFTNIDNVIVSTLYERGVFAPDVVTINHHLAHAASTFYSSSFKDAAILTMDGRGSGNDLDEQETTMFAIGSENNIQILDTLYGRSILTEDETNSGVEQTLITFSNSLGAFYKNITVLIGLGHDGEGKTMGLAAYGDAKSYHKQLRDYIELKSNGFYAIDNRAIFQYCSELVSETKRKLDEKKLFQFYADLAATAQQLLEEILIHCCNHLYQRTERTALCLAGGVALNTSANTKILQKTPFNSIFIQPAAGDNGIAIGCAMHHVYQVKQYERELSSKKYFSPYLGKSYSESDILNVLEKYEGQFIEAEDISNLPQAVAQLIANGKIVARCSGRSEIGPRALGNRSILADPRKQEMKDYINSQVKYREWFRPLAPMILEEAVSDYFTTKGISPYMLQVFECCENKKSLIGAVLHKDGSSRIQTVNYKKNPDIYEIIKQFEKLTGIPILLNTSFNGKNEPIVETPENAMRTFLNSPIDALILGNKLLLKNN